MPLPETIAVKYTEEAAEYLNMRPVVRQTFRFAELVDMVLTVTGKDVPRLQQVLRSGSVVYHSYRYWWTGFEAEARELDPLLAAYPQADPARPFRAQECTAVLLETSGHPPRRSVEFSRQAAAAKRLLQARSFWDSLLEPARIGAPEYREYSYARHADLFSRELSGEEIAALARDARRLATRTLRARALACLETARIIYICPRSK